VRNLEIATALLEGERGPRRDTVLANAAAAVAAGKGGHFSGGHGYRHGADPPTPIFFTA
jgi:anthranilate phosphoribosyltransferase